jgi:hypothetical protein
MKSINYLHLRVIQANEQRNKDRKDIVLKANKRYSFLDLSGEDVSNDDIRRFEEKLARLIQEKQATRLRLKVCNRFEHYQILYIVECFVLRYDTSI